MLMTQQLRPGVELYPGCRLGHLLKRTEYTQVWRVAAYLRRDARDLDRLAARNKIPGRKTGGKWRFNRREIDQWLDHSLSRGGNHDPRGHRLMARGFAFCTECIQGLP